MTARHLPLSLPVEDIDPVQNTDTLAGEDEENLSFPFVVTEEVQDRLTPSNSADQ